MNPLLFYCRIGGVIVDHLRAKKKHLPELEADTFKKLTLKHSQTRFGQLTMSR